MKLYSLISINKDFFNKLGFQNLKIFLLLFSLKKFFLINEIKKPIFKQ